MQSIMAEEKNTGSRFEKLVGIMARLRAPDGCPWDREQTHASLTQYLLEEAHEVLEAVDAGDAQHLKEELGDLLLQVIFHAQIAAEAGEFDIGDVVDGITGKLIRRHPNVFGNQQIASAAEQSANWEKLKQAEGKTSVVDGVPATLSGLLRAWRLQQKAATVGFDWPQQEPVWQKLQEEIAEFRKVSESDSPEQIEDEFGDLLFTLVNLSRFIRVNPETALRKATDKFVRRFRKVEAAFAAEQKSMREASLQELDAVWEKIKTEEDA